MKSVIESYQLEDALFYETRAFEESKKLIDDLNWAFITGNPGDGISALAIHLCLQLHDKGYEFLQIQSTQDWKSLVGGSNDSDISKPQVIFIDNIFGDMNMDERKVNDWIPLIPVMQRIINMRNGGLKVICTSKRYIFVDIKSKVEGFVPFYDANVVDLTDQFALTPKEKKEIWKIYSTKYHVKMKMPRCAQSKKCTPHGYPLCVVLFCTNVFLQRNGNAFFENPMKYICKHIKNFMDHDKVRYYILILTLLKQNQLQKSFLDEMSDEPDSVRSVAQAANLKSLPSKNDVETALDGLKNMYLREKKGVNLSISHDSVRENLACLYIKQTPKHAVENLDFSYLVHYTVFEKPSDGNKMVYVLPPHCIKHLLERMLKEIRNGNVVQVCEHQAWEHDDFLEELRKSLLQKDILSVNDIFCIKDISHKMVLNEALESHGHRKAVMVLRNETALQQCLEGTSYRIHFFKIAPKSRSKLNRCKQKFCPIL